MRKTNRVGWFVFGCLFWFGTSQKPELAAAGCAGEVIPSPNTGSGESVLTSVAAVSPTDMWSVGQGFPTDDGYQALIERWDGAAWNVVPAATLSAQHQLNAVAAAGANDVWAVGSLTSVGRGVIEHWDGTSWSAIPHPEPSVSSSPLLGVTVVSSNDVWAVGYFFDQTGYQTLIEHWDGASWSIVPSANQPGSNTLHAVAARAANDIWAVGEYAGLGFDGMLIEHWNGASWSLMS